MERRIGLVFEKKEKKTESGLRLGYGYGSAPYILE